MTRVFRDSYKLSFVMAIVFFVSIVISAYTLYTLPHDLHLTDGVHPIFMKVYLTIGISFLLGASALYAALQSHREVIVYRDRSQETDNANTEHVDNETKTTITLEGVKTGLLQANNAKEILKVCIEVVCKQLEAGQGAIYLTVENEDNRKIELKSGYALSISENTTISFDFGEGLVGQSALSGQTLYVDEVPQGYIKIISGLGSASPQYLLIVPIIKNKIVAGVMEIASFTPITDNQKRFVEESAHLLADRI